MGTQRNKLGNMVYYRRRGQEIARARVSPANPRSERQARQRMNFGTLQQAKSRLAEIVNHSYQGVTYGDISLNHFTKLNVPLLKYAAANPSENAAYFLPRGVKALAPNEYIVSDGSLQKLAQTWDSVNTSIILTGATVTAAISGPDDYVAQLASLGFAPGDQLTVMHLINTGAVIATTPAGDSIYDVQLEVKRIVFKTIEEISDWTGINTFWIGGDQADHSTVNPALLVADKSDDVVFYTGTNNEAGIFFDATPWGASAQSVAGVIIRSSLVNGQWLRSPQTLLVFDDGESRPSVADVLSTYMDTTTDPESPYYLNQSRARSAQQMSDVDFILISGTEGGQVEQKGGMYVFQPESPVKLRLATNVDVVTLDQVYANTEMFSVDDGAITIASDGQGKYINVAAPAGSAGCSCVFRVIAGSASITVNAYVEA